MDVLLRNVPEQVVITEQRIVDQAALESWLPGAMSRVLKAAGDAAAGTVGQPYLQRDQFRDEPVFIVIYEGNPNEGETAEAERAARALLRVMTERLGMRGANLLISAFQSGRPE